MFTPRIARARIRPQGGMGTSSFEQYKATVAERRAAIREEERRSSISASVPSTDKVCHDGDEFGGFDRVRYMQGKTSRERADAIFHAPVCGERDDGQPTCVMACFTDAARREYPSSPGISMSGRRCRLAGARAYRAPPSGTPRSAPCAGTFQHRPHETDRIDVVIDEQDVDAAQLNRHHRQLNAGAGGGMPANSFGWLDARDRQR